jgi:hypothetical protein
MNHRTVSTALVLFLLVACTPTKLVHTNLADTTEPEPVEIHAKLTGGGSASNWGKMEPKKFADLVVLPQPGGQLEITATATDNESGITKMEIYSNDKTCKWTNGAWNNGGGKTGGTIFRVNQTFAPDSNGMVPVTAVALENIQVASELGVFDKAVWQIYGTATNSAGKKTIIGPLTYIAVLATVPADEKKQECPGT